MQRYLNFWKYTGHIKSIFEINFQNNQINEVTFLVTNAILENTGQSQSVTSHK